MGLSPIRAEFAARECCRQLHRLRTQPFRGWMTDGQQQQRALSIQTTLDQMATYRGKQMAKGQRSSAGAGATWRGYKDIPLTDVQRDAFAHWDADDSEVYELAATVIQSGYKLTCVYNGANDTFTVTLTGGAATGAAAGYSMSAFAPDWYSALRLSLFKHAVIANGDWGSVDTADSLRWG